MEASKTSDIIEECRAIVKKEYKNSEESGRYYHNWGHTKYVYQRLVEIVENTESISQENNEALQLAALFHDVALTKNSPKHEEDSAAFAEKILTEKGKSKEQIALVKRLILATKRDYSPTDILESIIRDADLAHLKKNDYMSTSFISLYKEHLAFEDQTLSIQDWTKISIEFFDNQQFYTEYAKKTYNPKKLKNMEKIKKALEDKTDSIEKIKGMEKKSKKNKEEKPDRGIETLFRVSLRNHVNLSRIADNKANTLISVNAIIISIVFTVLFPRISESPFLIYPGLTLVSFNLLTIVLAIISTIPKTTNGKITKEDVKNKKGNLAFFGNFHRMSIIDYEWSVGELMKDKDYLYKSLTRDLYYLGKVLNSKYTFLRLAYYTFITGLAASIIMFVVSSSKA